MISDKVTNQVTRRFNDIGTSLNSQGENSNSRANAQKILPSIQNTLIMKGLATSTMMKTNPYANSVVNTINEK